MNKTISSLNFLSNSNGAWKHVVMMMFVSKGTNMSRSVKGKYEDILKNLLSMEFLFLWKSYATTTTNTEINMLI